MPSAGDRVGECCLLIALYLAHELSYDRHYDKSDRIYRVVVEYGLQGEGRRQAFTTTPLAEALVREYPDLKQAARIAPDVFEAGSNLVRTVGTDRNRYEEGFIDTGVLEDLPTNTYLRFDYLLSMEGLEVSKIPNWSFSNYVTYVQLAADD